MSNYQLAGPPTVQTYGMGRRLINEYPSDYVVVDLETTGLDPKNCEIIEIAAIRYSDNRKVDAFTTLVKPSQPISEEITALTGITNRMLGEHGMEPDKALKEFVAFVGKSTLLGYCVNFDVRFLFEALRKRFNIVFDNNYVDVHPIAKKLLKGQLQNYSQANVCRALGISAQGAHRAGNDCRMCNDAYQKLKQMMLPGYTAPSIPKQDLQVSDKAKLQLPFAKAHFYFEGCFSQITKFDLTNLVYELGAEVDELVTESTTYVIVGAEPTVTSEQLNQAVVLKAQGHKLYLLQEERFLEALLDRGFVTKA